MYRSVDHVLVALVGLGSLGGRLRLGGRGGGGRRLRPAAPAPGRQVLEHGLAVAGQHLLQAACKMVEQ